MIGSVAALRTYAAARGDNTVSAADDTTVGYALERASDYITYHYVDRFQSGYDETSPRVDLAAYEAAILELSTPGFFSRTYTPDERKVLTQVGDIRWQVVGGSNSTVAAPVSTRIEAMLRPYLDDHTHLRVV